MPRHQPHSANHEARDIPLAIPFSGKASKLPSRQGRLSVTIECEGKYLALEVRLFPENAGEERPTD